MTGKREIVRLELKDPVNKPDRAGGREIIFDVYCKDIKNNHYIIEMSSFANHFYCNIHLNSTSADKQLEGGSAIVLTTADCPLCYFYERSQYYIARALGGQLKSYDNYLKLVPVVFVGVVNYSLDVLKKYKRYEEFTDQSIITLKKDNTLASQDKQVISKYSFINHATHEIIPAPLMELNYVELPLFNKSLKECHTEVDKWLYLMKTIQDFQEIPSSFKKSKNFVRACQTLEEKNWKKGEIETYVEQMEAIGKDDRIKEGAHERGLELGIKEGITKGITQGITQGISQGEHKKAVRIALKLLAQNKSIEEIVDLTDLTPEEIKALKK